MSIDWEAQLKKKNLKNLDSCLTWVYCHWAPQRLIRSWFREAPSGHVQPLLGLDSICRLCFTSEAVSGWSAFHALPALVLPATRWGVIMSLQFWNSSFCLCNRFPPTLLICPCDVVCPHGTEWTELQKPLPTFCRCRQFYSVRRRRTDT